MTPGGGELYQNEAARRFLQPSSPELHFSSGCGKCSQDGSRQGKNGEVGRHECGRRPRLHPVAQRLAPMMALHTVSYRINGECACLGELHPHRRPQRFAQPRAGHIEAPSSKYTVNLTKYCASLRYLAAQHSRTVSSWRSYYGFQAHPLWQTGPPCRIFLANDSYLATTSHKTFTPRGDGLQISEGRVKPSALCK